ncbi:MAG: hypothetical protein Kow0083_00440 [Methylophaga sp.]
MGELLMAKNQVMGNDPLAWLVNDTDFANSSTDKETAEVTENTGESDVALVEQSFILLANQHEQIASAFFEHLFSHNPELRPLFEGVSLDGQRKKLMVALMLLVNNLRKPGILRAYLKGLGERHQVYGVRAEDYEKFKRSLLAVLGRMAGEMWTEAMETAWRNTLNSVTRQMMDFRSVRASEPVKQTVSGSDVLAKALEEAVTAVMLLDRELGITYANASMRQLLETHESLFQQLCTAPDRENLTGSKLALFETSLSHQQDVLSDPTKLPYKTRIQVATLVLGIAISAISDETDTCTGYLLECHTLTGEKGSHEEMTGTVPDAVSVEAYGQSLTAMMAGIPQLEELVSGSASIGQAQISDIEQISKALAQMNDMIRQNAALLEKVLVISESLKVQEQHLQQLASLPVGNEVTHLKQDDDKE